ncbi:MAG: hypothetical protein JXQ82_09615 [Methanomicrobiaceae archaeon]|nr:hypothetical protein [Methanomicrobiaceae archaeon]
MKFSGIRKHKLSHEEMGIVGAYSSFFGLLLIATILSYRSILFFTIENLITQIPEQFNYSAIVFSFVVFGIIFILIPALPVSFDIYENAVKKNFKLMCMLLFLIIIYAAALIFQMFQAYLEMIGSIIA